MKPNPHPVPSSIRKAFSDFFDRTNTQNDLGVTPDGRRWDSLRGVFRVLFGRAVSDSSPSSYPIASVSFPYTDVEIELDDIDNSLKKVYLLLHSVILQ